MLGYMSARRWRELRTCCSVCLTREELLPFVSRHVSLGDRAETVAPRGERRSRQQIFPNRDRAGFATGCHSSSVGTERDACDWVARGAEALDRPDGGTCVERLTE